MQRASTTILASLDPAGEATWILTPPSFEDPRWYIEVGGLGWPMPFSTRPMMAVSADGRLFADLSQEEVTNDGGRLRIVLVETTGDTLFSRAYPFPGQPVTAAQRDSALAWLAPGGVPREGPPGLGARRQEVARDRMPTVHSPVRALRIGLDHTVWIDLRSREEEETTLVLDRHGAPVAAVAVPAGVQIAQARSDRVWAIETDALGLTSVVRYRVRASGVWGDAGAAVGRGRGG